MCTLIRHTRTHTQTLAQTHKLTLVCCWLQFYGAFGRLVKVITLVVSQSELPSSSCFLFFPPSLTFLTSTRYAKSLIFPHISLTLFWISSQLKTEIHFPHLHSVPSFWRTNTRFPQHLSLPSAKRKATHRKREIWLCTAIYGLDE